MKKKLLEIINWRGICGTNQSNDLREDTTSIRDRILNGKQIWKETEIKDGGQENTLWMHSVCVRDDEFLSNWHRSYMFLDFYS